MIPEPDMCQKLSRNNQKPCLIMNAFELQPNGKCEIFVLFSGLASVIILRRGLHHVIE